jgi:tetratricopeptide (TPR) repeat protein
LGKHPDAAEAFKRAVRDDPNFAEAHFNLGLSYFHMNDTARASREFEKAVALEPRASGAYTQLGELYLKQGKRDRAVEAFNKAINAKNEDDRAASRSPAPYRGLALAYLGLGRTKEAVATLEDAVDAFPNDASTHTALAEAYQAMGDLDKATKEYELRIKFDPSAQARIDLANLYAKRRIAAKATQFYQGVLKDEPENRAAALGLADLYLAMGDYVQTEKTLNELLKKAPDDLEAKGRLGILHSRTGRPDLAFPELMTVVSKDSSQLLAQTELGFLYARSGDQDTALKTLTKVLNIEPRNPLALLYLGHTLYAKGQTKRAEESFLASAQTDPSFAEPHYALGQLYEDQKRQEEAIREYKRTLTLQPGHQDAQAAVKRLAPSQVPPSGGGKQ